MATRLKLELDPETFGRLVETAVTEQRPADWQAEVILRRALGTWEEPRIGYEILDADPSAAQATAKRETTRVPA
jgi:hypothetical protein